MRTHTVFSVVIKSTKPNKNQVSYPSTSGVTTLRHFLSAVRETKKVVEKDEETAAAETS